MQPNCNTFYYVKINVCQKCFRYSLEIPMAMFKILAESHHRRLEAVVKQHGNVIQKTLTFFSVLNWLALPYCVIAL